MTLSAANFDRDTEQEATTALTPLTTTSLRERAVAAIRAGIITGEIEAGQIYSTPALAERLGVSVTPVREAMLDLASEGLVEAVRNRGFRVVPLTEADLEEILQLRMLLEVPAMERVAGIAQTLPQSTRETFSAIADEIKEHAQAGDLARVLEADRRFHVGLVALLGNRRLAELVGLLRDHSRLPGLRRLSRDVLVGWGEEHVAILEAALAGDTKTVKTVMQEHMDHSRGVWAGHQPADER